MDETGAPVDVVASLGTSRRTDRALSALAGADEQLELAQSYFRKAELAPEQAAWRDTYYRRAEALAELVLESHPNSAEAHFLMFATRGRRILATGPDMSDLWQLPTLTQHLDRTLELDPAHAHALAAKGGLLLDLPGFVGGDVEGARRYLERALELNPGGVRTRLSLARALIRQGHREPALAHLNTAAHHACVLRRKAALVEIDGLLAELASESL